MMMTTMTTSAAATTASATTSTTTTRRVALAARAPRVRRARASTARRAGDGDGDGDAAQPLNEASLADVMAKLKQAEADKAKLQAELSARAQGGAAESVDALAKMTPAKSKARVDGVGKREQLFSSRTEGDAWLRDGMEFLVRDQPSEAGGVNAANAGLTEEEQGTVNRRLIVGLALTAAFAAFSQVSIEAPEPTKPLFFYLVPIVRSRALLVRATTLAEEGEWEDLSSTVARVVGAPNDVKMNLFKAAAYLSGSEESKAKSIAFDFLEYMEKVDYSKYYENLGAVNGSKAAEYAKFSAKASKSAIGKLDEFLALMDRESVAAATSQVMAFETEFAAQQAPSAAEEEVVAESAAEDAF
jgi:hypothetical protein